MGKYFSCYAHGMVLQAKKFFLFYRNNNNTGYLYLAPCKRPLVLHNAKYFDRRVGIWKYVVICRLKLWPRYLQCSSCYRQSVWGITCCEYRSDRRSIRNRSIGSIDILRHTTRVEPLFRNIYTVLDAHVLSSQRNADYLERLLLGLWIMKLKWLKCWVAEISQVTNNNWNDNELMWRWILSLTKRFIGLWITLPFWKRKTLIIVSLIFHR